VKEVERLALECIRCRARCTRAWRRHGLCRAHIRWVSTDAPSMNPSSLVSRRHRHRARVANNPLEFESRGANDGRILPSPLLVFTFLVAVAVMQVVSEQWDGGRICFISSLQRRRSRHARSPCASALHRDLPSIQRPASKLTHLLVSLHHL